MKKSAGNTNLLRPILVKQRVMSGFNTANCDTVEE